MSHCRFVLSHHAKAMLEERGIQLAWVEEVIEKPEGSDRKEDGTMHFWGPSKLVGGAS